MMTPIQSVSTPVKAVTPHLINKIKGKIANKLSSAMKRHTLKHQRG